MPDLYDTLYQAGFRGEALKTAWAIAMAESGGRARALNPRGADLSYGLFQINMRGALGPDRRKRYALKSNEDLYDPATNARVAFQLSGGGKNWSPWTTYTSGAYQQYLDKAPTEPRQPAQTTQQPIKQRAKTKKQLPPFVERQAGAVLDLRELNSLARQFGFKSFAKAYGMEDGEVTALLKTTLAQDPSVPKIGPKMDIPVVSTAPGAAKHPLVQRVVAQADEYLGTPYVWGGKTPRGFDCSGFVQYLYKRYAGIDPGGYTIAQWRNGKSVPKAKLKPGDVVFFRMERHPETGEYGPGHNGLYLGNGLFIQSPKTGDVVKISRMADRSDYVGARRFR